LLKLIPESSKEYVLNDDEAESLADAYLKEGAITKNFTKMLCILPLQQ
jgi:hypothetical protein